jgi:hypothetical protein
MDRIEGSVGQGGDNREEDVRVVQEMLNRQDLSPLRKLAVDGRAGPATTEAIRHFQTRVLSMASPDGRVDPDGRTFRRLATSGGERGKGESTETRQADRAARGERVDPRVKETDVTTRILDDLVPQLGNTRARVIAGYLSDSDQFWKVNYHWEYLLQTVDHCLTLPVEDRDEDALRDMRSTLLGCPPQPASGYTSSPVGKPEDRSEIDEVLRRHKVLSSVKRSFGALVDSAKLKEKSRKSPHVFDLAAAPVAVPGTSKHGKGYALDIEGDNGAIKSLCKGLGATLVFDEKSHVHVEFANGVSQAR